MYFVSSKKNEFSFYSTYSHHLSLSLVFWFKLRDNIYCPSTPFERELELETRQLIKTREF